MANIEDLVQEAKDSYDLPLASVKTIYEVQGVCFDDEEEAILASQIAYAIDNDLGNEVVLMLLKDFFQ